VLATLPEESVNCCVTSPPYYRLRDYGVSAQIGLEDTPQAYVDRLVKVFREVRRVLRLDGSLWVNIGDSYLKRSLIGVPWMLAVALRKDGWFLRSEIIWHKTNPMPESVRDRPTRAHEQVFMLTKTERYYYDAAAIREPNTTKPHAHGASKQRHQLFEIRNSASDAAFRQPNRIWAAAGGRNMRTVRSVNVSSFHGAHFATFPSKLIEPFVLAGCPVGGLVLDPFSAAATTGVVSLQHGRRYLGIELNPDYCLIGEQRLKECSRRRSSFSESLAA
jgi:DNA modification methylase